jgi:hypothetical protein
MGTVRLHIVAGSMRKLRDRCYSSPSLKQVKRSSVRKPHFVAASAAHLIPGDSYPLTLSGRPTVLEPKAHEDLPWPIERKVFRGRNRSCWKRSPNTIEPLSVSIFTTLFFCLKTPESPLCRSWSSPTRRPRALSGCRSCT